MTVDLVLVNPNNRNPAPFAAIEPPLWLGLMAGYHLQDGKEIAIVDAETDDLTITETVLKIKELKPREIVIVVMGNNPSVSSTPKMPVAERLLEYLPDAKLAGLHPLAVKHPKALMNTYYGTPTVPWGLYDFNKYRAHNWHCLEDISKRSPYAVLYTSLNCPYSCFYCNIHTLYGDRQIKYRPLDKIYEELVYFASQGVRNIKVWDELFALSAPRVDVICEFIIEQKLDFNLWAYARVNTVNKRMVDKLKRAGFNWLAFGFESQSQPVRLMSNKEFSGLQVEQAIQMTRQAGINIIGNFMFGLPGESMEDMQASVDMAERENFEWVNYYVALPYPGSPWYESLKDKPTNWSSFDQYGRFICAPSDVLLFKDNAFRHYFQRPEYLKMIRDKFGPRAVEHIKEMLEWKRSGSQFQMDNNGR